MDEEDPILLTVKPGFMADSLHFPEALESNTTEGLINPRRILAFFVALVPPTLLAGGNPETFLHATSIAGAYFDTLIYGILPPAMAFALRNKQVQQEQEAAAPATAAAPAGLIPGGVAALASCAVGSLTIGLSKLAGDLGLSVAAGGVSSTLSTEVAQLATAGTALVPSL